VGVIVLIFVITQVSEGRGVSLEKLEEGTEPVRSTTSERQAA
jgi:hypothetical protein